jgi:hypothetical protein
VAAWTFAPVAAAASRVAQTQQLAVFVNGQTAMSKPDNDSARRIWVERGRPITEGRTVLPVIGHRTGANGVRRLKVRLPGRPNNSTGWIRKARTTSASTSWHLVVDLSERRGPSTATAKQCSRSRLLSERERRPRHAANSASRNRSG